MKVIDYDVWSFSLVCDYPQTFQTRANVLFFIMQIRNAEQAQPYEWLQTERKWKGQFGIIAMAKHPPLCKWKRHLLTEKHGANRSGHSGKCIPDTSYDQGGEEVSVGVKGRPLLWRGEYVN